MKKKNTLEMKMSKKIVTNPNPKKLKHKPVEADHIPEDDVDIVENVDRNDEKERKMEGLGTDIGGFREEFGTDDVDGESGVMENRVGESDAASVCFCIEKKIIIIAFYFLLFVFSLLSFLLNRFF